MTSDTLRRSKNSVHCLATLFPPPGSKERWRERTNSTELSSDFYMHATARVCSPNITQSVKSINMEQCTTQKCKCVSAALCPQHKVSLIRMGSYEWSHWLSQATLMSLWSLHTSFPLCSGSQAHLPMPADSRMHSTLPDIWIVTCIFPLGPSVKSHWISKL